MLRFLEIRTKVDSSFDPVHGLTFPLPLESCCPHVQVLQALMSCGLSRAGDVQLNSLEHPASTSPNCYAPVQTGVEAIQPQSGRNVAQDANG